MTFKNYLWTIWMAMILVAMGCQPDQQAAFESAIVEGEVGKVQLLIEEKNVDVTKELPKSGKYPLELAAEQGRAATLEMLLKFGADPDKAKGDESPLLLALNAPDKGKSALILIKAGVDLNVKDAEGFSPMDLALLFEMPKVVQALLNEGADPQKGGVYATPLHGAAESGDVNTIQTLLNSGAYVDAKDEYDESPLFYAVRGGGIPAMETLIQYDADINFENDLGETPLFQAIYDADSSGVVWLIEAGATVNHQDDGGDTPLLRAAVEGDEAIVQALLLQGADPKIKNRKGETALDLARSEGRLEVIEILESI